MSDSEKPTFLGLEGMLQDLGANSGKAKSAPPPAPASVDDAEPPTLDPPTLDRKRTARETPSAKTPKPPPLPLFAYGSRSSPVPPSAEEGPSSSARRQLDRGDPVTALEPYADIQDPPLDVAPPTEMSPMTQPVTSADLEPSAPKSELAKTRVSAAISVPPSQKSVAPESAPEPSIPVVLVKDAEKKPESDKKPESEKKDEPEKKIVSAREALEAAEKADKKKKKEPAAADARFPTLKALDDQAEKPKTGLWIALVAILLAVGGGWYFLRGRLSGGTSTTHPTDTAQLTSAPVTATASAPIPSVSAATSATPSATAPIATAPASAVASASVAALASVAAPIPPGTGAKTGAGGGTHATATHATATAPPPPTTATATAPPPPTTTTPPPPTATAPPTSTKPSLINEP